jgi:hypothetical protein
MCPSTAAGTGDVRRSVDGTSNGGKCTVPTLIDPMTAVKPAIATGKDTTSTDREKKMLDTILELNGWTLRADKWLAEEIHGCCCDCCSICVDQQRGTWLVRLFVLAQFGFVGGVDIYTGLWAGAGFVCTAAWASLGVSVLAFGFNIWGGVFHRDKDYLVKGLLLLCVGFFWAPIEIALKAHGLRVLNAAESGDGTTRAIRVLFDIEIAAFTVLELFATCCVGCILYIIITDKKEEEEGAKKSGKNQRADEENQGGC